MSGAKRYERAREHMDRLLCAEQPPEPRWDAIERELFARIEAPAPAGPAARPRPSPLGRALAFAAAAAALALVVLAASRSAPPVASTPAPRTRDLAEVPRAAEGAGAAGDLDFRALRSGDSIETAASAVSFVDAGSVRWTLLPRSRVVVRTVGAAGVGHVVALEHGSLRAEVVTRAPEEGLVEAFAVDAGGTRVAVHGTLFTVTRLDDRIEVDVEHGTVAVGPAAYRGATTARLLVGPSRGAFSLDGGREARLLPRPAQPESAPSVAAPAPPPPPPAADTQAPNRAAAGRAAAALAEAPAASAEPAAPALAEPRPPSPVAPSPVPAAPVPEAEAAPLPPTLTPASVQALLSGCFAHESARGSSSVRRSIASTLRISVRPDGRVAALRFDPPLRPALQACAEALYKGRFAGGPQQIDIPLAIED